MGWLGHCCEHCGYPATHIVADVLEQVPEPGVEYIRWVRGNAHYYCDEHYRRAAVFCLDGHVEQEEASFFQIVGPDFGGITRWGVGSSLLICGR